MGAQKSDTIWQLNNDNRQATLKTACLGTGNVMNSSSWKHKQISSKYISYLSLLSHLFIAFNSHFYIFYLYEPINYTWYTPHIEITHMGSVAQVCPPLSDLIDCTHQAPLFMELPRQVCWSGLPFASPGDLLYTGIKSKSLMSPSLADGFFTIELSGKPHWSYTHFILFWYSLLCFSLTLLEGALTLKATQPNNLVVDWIGIEWARYEWNQKMEILNCNNRCHCISCPRLWFC